MLDMDFLKDKVVDADDLVDMIRAQMYGESEEVIEFGERIQGLIHSHAKLK